ncbi:MAG: hypothetical protein COU85_01060 [Candidatus Portnoybacteria bacterium CG10_big_fil_rev_8_21_14_0_10_44_7]|uniref:Peptidoglycan recognition protein family domain-containing protein n=1 Tax=Candidatus Portnoybacteria bacterium CG10_big_fil_rev_8_21_14_0_10_44_7 TaxID=1974816 RepID=A0A2M8KJ60_9BACT|nr:MAG: hypothetical protein COU85_01060 [Candidatus Portnoybacteria bacterium CG10_big_fil_rev_8_21_14_0_10_44_7]
MLLAGVNFKPVRIIFVLCYNVQAVNKFFTKISLVFAGALFVFSGLFFITPAQIQAANLLEVPKIISRAEWGADEALKTWASEYPTDNQGLSINQADYIVIHHTASSQLTPDNDSSGRYTGMVKAIYRWHATNATWDDYENGTVQGFGDIGYHYLVDPNGNIYQGRAGANGVIGAHVYGHNQETIGIALLGTYGAQLGAGYVAHEITPAAQGALARLVGWLAAANGINLDAKILIDGKTQYPLVGHRDVRPTKCPGDNLWAKIPALRQQAAQDAQAYQNYLYQQSDSPEVFLLRDGLRRNYDNLQTAQQFVTNANIVNAAPFLTALFAQRAFLKYPDGTLLQAKNQPSIYLLENGQKRALAVTAEQFTQLGFVWADVVSIDPLDIALYSDGLPVKFAPANKLISDSHGRVYQTQNGRKRWVVSQALFNYLGYQWSQVAKDAAAENYLPGEVLKYKDSVLLKGQGPAVYLIEGGQKRLVTSLQLFSHLGLSWKNLIEISDQELAFYNDGPDLRYRSGTLIRQQGQSQVYLLDDVVKKPFLSAGLFLANGYNWKNILNISAAEMEQYQTGGYVGYPSGTLLRAQGGQRVFVVKAGGLEWIESAQKFLAAGYRWNQIKIIPDSEFALFYPGIAPSDLPVAPVENNTSALGELIRIGVTKIDTGQEVRITANGAFAQYDAVGNLVKNYTASQVAIIMAQSGAYAKLQAVSDDVILEALSYEDRPAWNQNLNYNRFRSTLEIKYSDYSQSFWLINQLPLEYYVAGIGEALNADHPQYQRAFAIMTRSYAEFHRQNGGKRPGEIFDLNNTSSDQVFKGYVFETIAPNLVAAAQATAGLVMKYNDQVARAVYSSDSGGTTASACSVWGGEFCGEAYGYLKGNVQDPAGTEHNQSKVAASHGVGVSCVGARRLAELNYGHEDILKYYYSGIALEKIY